MPPIEGPGTHKGLRLPGAPELRAEVTGKVRQVLVNIGRTTGFSSSGSSPGVADIEAIRRPWHLTGRRRSDCRAGLDHAVANDVFDEDGNKGQDRCIDELLSSLLTPALDLSGPLLVAKPLMAGQLVRDLGHGSRDR
jgi:hypothetical protein